MGIQVPSAQPREDNPNFRQETTEDLLTKVITPIPSLFSILLVPPLLFIFTLLLTVPNKWVSQMGVKCK